ncbi:MAG: sigma-70 family RNA polymerase sigma factor [Bacteroidota bacterium]
MLFVRKHTRENPYRDHADDALIQLYQQTGKEIYAAELFQRYVDKVYIIVRKYVKDRETSKDVVMNVFEKVLKNLRNTKIDTFGNWVHTIARNECSQHHRKLSSQAKQLSEWGDLERNSQNSVENDYLQHLIKKEDDDTTKKALEKALNSLKDHHRTCIKLLYFEKKSYKEIAQITGFSDKEVKSYIQHAKNNLRKKLSKKNGGRTI